MARRETVCGDRLTSVTRHGHQAGPGYSQSHRCVTRIGASASAPSVRPRVRDPLSRDSCLVTARAASHRPALVLGYSKRKQRWPPAPLRHAKEQRRDRRPDVAPSIPRGSSIVGDIALRQRRSATHERFGDDGGTARRPERQPDACFDRSAAALPDECLATRGGPARWTRSAAPIAAIPRPRDTPVGVHALRTRGPGRTTGPDRSQGRPRPIARGLPAVAAGR